MLSTMACSYLLHKNISDSILLSKYTDIFLEKNMVSLVVGSYIRFFVFLMSSIEAILSVNDLKSG